MLELSILHLNPLMLVAALIADVKTDVDEKSNLLGDLISEGEQLNVSSQGFVGGYG